MEIKGRSLLKYILILALPIAFQNLLISSASLVDTAMVVRLGDVATSALGVAGRYSFLLNVTSFGFCSGCMTLISQYWGAQQFSKIRRSYGVALTFSTLAALVFGVALFLFPRELMRVFTDEASVADAGAGYLKIFAFATVISMYTQVTCSALRATERVYVPLVASAVGVVVNVFFNYSLIYGNFGFPEMGLRGAATATVISICVQAAIVTVAVMKKGTLPGGKLKEIFGYSGNFLKKYFKIAMPVFLNEFSWAIGTNVLVMVYARQGVENHSGYTVYDTIQQLFFVFFVGMSHACAILVGKSVGAGEHTNAYYIAKKFLIYTPIMGLAVGAIMILVREPLLSLMKIETQAAHNVASSLIVFYGLWMGIRFLSYIGICGIFRAGGDTKTGCFIDIGSLYIFGIPAALILGFVLNIPFVVLVACVFIAEDLPKTVMIIKRFKGKKWIKQFTNKNSDMGEADDEV